MLRMGNTGREMVQSGTWVKVARKHYRHVSGAEIRYNSNRWLWEIVGTEHAHELLWAARHVVERIGFGWQTHETVQ